jgi:hypothetical protein
MINRQAPKTVALAVANLGVAPVFGRRRLVSAPARDLVEQDADLAADAFHLFGATTGSAARRASVERPSVAWGGNTISIGSISSVLTAVGGFRAGLDSTSDEHLSSVQSPVNEVIFDLTN